MYILVLLKARLLEKVGGSLDALWRLSLQILCARPWHLQQASRGSLLRYRDIVIAKGSRINFISEIILRSILEQNHKMFCEF